VRAILTRSDSDKPLLFGGAEIILCPDLRLIEKS
jgi:hypothetical protein